MAFYLFLCDGIKINANKINVTFSSITTDKIIWKATYQNEEGWNSNNRKRKVKGSRTQFCVSFSYFNNIRGSVLFCKPTDNVKIPFIFSVREVSKIYCTIIKVNVVFHVFKFKLCCFFKNVHFRFVLTGKNFRAFRIEKLKWARKMERQLRKPEKMVVFTRHYWIGNSYYKLQNANFFQENL